jgi:O-acetyl-ADP-ribose deacetylase (regulator of RNase III)
LLHAAAVQGEIGKGYVPIQGLADCIRNALDIVNSEKYRAKRSSILFPIFGTGTARGKIDTTVKQLVDETIDYIENRPNNAVKRIFFLALTDKQRDACLTALGAAKVEFEGAS